MTKDEAIAMGFQVAGQDGKVILFHKPTRLAINVGSLHDKKPADIISEVYNSGVTKGQKVGWLEKTNEIRGALGIEKLTLEETEG